MKKRLTLQLNIYLKYGDKACLVFKKEGVLYRINNLLNPKWFIGSMVQLDKAIQGGANQYCHYVLNGTRGCSWVLALNHEPGLVLLQLFRHGKEGGNSEPVFCWEGSPEAFRNAVRDLGLMYQLSGMFGIYRK